MRKAIESRYEISDRGCDRLISSIVAEFYDASPLSLPIATFICFQSILSQINTYTTFTKFERFFWKTIVNSKIGLLLLDDFPRVFAKYFIE